MSVFKTEIIGSIPIQPVYFWFLNNLNIVFDNCSELTLPLDLIHASFIFNNLI